MKKKIINGILAASILVAAPSAFVSCKDNDADVRTELLGKIAELKNQLDNIQLKAGPQGEKGDTGAAGKDGKDGSVVTIGSNGNWFIDGVDTGVPTQIKGETGEKGADGHTPVITIGENGNWFVDGKDTGVSALGTKGEKGDKGDMASVLTIGENGNWFIDGVDTNVPARGEKGEKGDKGEQGTIGSIVSIGENGNWFIDGVDTNVPARGEDGVTPILVQDPTDGHWYWWIKGQYQGVRADGIDGTGIGGDTWTVGPAGTWLINGTDTGILAYNYDQMVKLIKDQIYNAERNGLTPELEDQIKKLLNNLDNSLTKSINNMITDVIVERTENSLYGQLAIPGWNPLVLSAYYGTTDHDVIFPKPADKINITNVTPFTLDAGSEIKGDGGKVYVTLNPNEVSVAGKSVSLVTSQDNASPFTLSNLQASNAELTFGWNRTRGANGLYEATAELIDAKSAGINVKTDILQKDAKEILNNFRKGAQVNAIKSLASFMADAFTDAIETLPAYAVKTTWGDPLLGTKSIRSGYDIAAFSIKPLSYTFEYSGTTQDVVIGDIANLYTQIASFIAKSVADVLPAYPEFEIMELKPENATAKVLIKSGAHAGETWEVQLKNLVVDEYSPISALANNLAKVNEFIKKMNSLMADTEATKAALKANIQAYLSNYSVMVNKEFGEMTINNIIQPFLLVKHAGGIRGAWGEFSGTIQLLPTSYTGELLAPAYKKFVVITAIDGVPATAADNTGDLGKILDGGVQQVEFTPAAGKTYTIAYSALDYFGNIVTTYYLISGKL